MLRFTWRIRRKRIILLLLWISCILPKAHIFTPCFRQQQLVNSALLLKTQSLNLLFHQKTLKTIWKHTVAKATLNLTPHFQHQRSVILRAFGEKGEWSKTSNIWANLKKIFKDQSFTFFLHLLVIERCKKRFKNRLWKSRACIPLMSIFKTHPLLRSFPHNLLS